MAGATPDLDGIDRLISILEAQLVRLQVLERATGTQVGSLVAQVQAALANINATVQTAIAANSYTKTEIDGRIASTPGAVVVNGTFRSTARATINAGITSTDIYARQLTYGGAYTSTYTHVDGTMGTVPSSRRFKQDISPVTFNPALIPALQVVCYRYIAAVENDIDGTLEYEIGLIAEEVDALGLYWLVDYDGEGRPFGVKYERLSLLLLSWAQSIESRLAAAGI